MKKHMNPLAAARAQFKAGIRSIASKKNPRYIYTEDDLGEGLLDAGINSNTYIMKHNFKQVPWISMLRSKIS